VGPLETGAVVETVGTGRLVGVFVTFAAVGAFGTAVGPFGTGAVVGSFKNRGWKWGLSKLVRR